MLALILQFPAPIHKGLTLNQVNFHAHKHQERIKFQHPKWEVKKQKQETNLIERKQYHQKDL